MDEVEAKKRLSKLVSPEVLADVTRIKIMKALSAEEMYCSQVLVAILTQDSIWRFLRRKGSSERLQRDFTLSLALPNLK